MAISIQGECNCSAVKFELLKPIPSMYKCYCTLCQKQSGTASNASTVVLASDFRWIRGLEYIKTWKKDTGFNSHFCRTCGSPVPNAVGDSYVWIPVGLIGSVDAEVVVNLFENRAPNWEADCINKIEAGPRVKDVDDLFERLTAHAPS